MKAAANHAAKVNAPPPRKRGGRSGIHLYSEKLADEICDRLASGEPLRQICRDPHMPDEKAVRKWIVIHAETFGPRYALAREMGFDSLAEELLEISDADCIAPDGWVDAGAVQKARLMSDNRKWLLSKLVPKVYGDKVVQEVTGADGQALLTAQNDPSKVALVLLGILQRSREKVAIEHQPAVEDELEIGRDTSPLP